VVFRPVAVYCGVPVSVEAQVSRLVQGCVDVVRLDDLRSRLALGRPLVVKVGFDPTAPDLHLGHTVLIRKMKHFQDLGHTVVFVVGDFTGMIGDPSGRSKTRPPLTTAEIERNAETYKAQVFKLLDRERTVVEFNSRWLVELGSEGMIKLAARYNVAQMMERREFRQRFESGQPIAVHEFLYPLVQAYDSVALQADVELGGTDQLFNLNVGRDIMPAYGLPPQVVMTTPLLEGLDGVEKMSKSLGNYVGVTDAPVEMFGKLMSVSDELMWKYYLLLTDRTGAEVDALKQRVAAGTQHPRQAKVDLARSIVTEFHDGPAADAASAEFDRVHARGELPSDLKVFAVDFAGEPTRGLARVIVDAGLARSTSEAARKIQQGGVRLNGERVADAKHRIDPEDLPLTMQVGRSAVRLDPSGGA
jgi:tyrosyl-tRNA synthetase